jgi:hypothetical protein
MHVQLVSFQFSIVNIYVHMICMSKHALRFVYNRILYYQKKEVVYK